MDSKTSAPLEYKETLKMLRAFSGADPDGVAYAAVSWMVHEYDPEHPENGSSGEVRTMTSATPEVFVDPVNPEFVMLDVSIRSAEELDEALGALRDARDSASQGGSAKAFCANLTLLDNVEFSERGDSVESLQMMGPLLFGTDVKDGYPVLRMAFFYQSVSYIVQQDVNSVEIAGDAVNEWAEELQPQLQE